MGGQDSPIMNRTEVAELLGLSPKSISTYLLESKSELGPARRPGRYADHPFPAPSGYLGRAPYWDAKRKKELLAWFESRPGQGAGGGPKPRRH